MPTDTQIGWIFSLFDRLVVCPRVAGCFLLRANVVIQFSVPRFEFASRSRYIFFYRRKLCVDRVELLLGQTHCVRAAQARADKFCTLFRRRARRALILADRASKSAGAGLSVCRS